MGVRAARPSRWSAWWSGHAFTLGLSAVVIVLSVIITPSTGFLDLFGVTIPELCAWRRLFGIECLGCGMTRSFVFMGHLDPQAAWEMNKLGPLLWTVTAAQLPYRTWRIATGPRGAKELARAARDVAA